MADEYIGFEDIDVGPGPVARDVGSSYAAYAYVDTIFLYGTQELLYHGATRLVCQLGLTALPKLILHSITS